MGVLHPSGTPFTYNNKQYIYDSGSRTWADAATNCKTLYGGTLASFHSEADYTAIRNGVLANYGSFMGYFGLNDVAVEGTFVYEDGTAFDYSRWGGSNPDNYLEEDCVHILSGGDWNDLPCATVLTGSICKIGAPSRPAAKGLHASGQRLPTLANGVEEG